MSETIYVVVDNEGICYGAFADEKLANEVANYNDADVCITQLRRNRQEMYQCLYNKQVVDT